jgi:hypothetical protein
MTDHDQTRRDLTATEPGALDRIRRYRGANGDVALAKKMCDIAIRTGLTYAALATYYPSVALAAARWRLRPQETILRRIEGECRHEGGRFAVFLVYQPRETPWYVQNALEALRQAGVNVLLVFNHELDPEREAYFRRSSSRILIRNNAGLDIGGYRDGYLELRDDPRVERLLFLNDSVYFFRDGLTAFFDRLMGSQADVAAPFENRQHHYHIQSFCLAISGAMVRHPAVGRFFQSYLPINSRRWAIHEGEVALSRLLTATTDRIEILYRVEDLLDHEAALPAAVTERLTHFLPILLRKRYDWMRQGEAGHTASGLASFVRLASGYSQVHTAGFLFRLVLGSPLLKRDLVFREQFTLDDSRALLVETGHEGHLDSIVADLNRKGDGSSLRGLNRGRYVAGMI